MFGLRRVRLLPLPLELSLRLLGEAPQQIDVPLDLGVPGRTLIARGVASRRQDAIRPRWLVRCTACVVLVHGALRNLVEPATVLFEPRFPVVRRLLPHP